MAVSEVSPLLLSALRRLVDLIDVPEEVPILAPLIQREICYPLLAGDQGKRLRLHEAKRQMLTVHLDASLASLRVGYESPSRFSREYSRLFGAPPLRDIRNLYQLSAGGFG